jgi:hypothetical protein
VAQEILAVTQDPLATSQFKLFQQGVLEAPVVLVETLVSQVVLGLIQQHQIQTQSLTLLKLGVLQEAVLVEMPLEIQL